jgi:FkbM family methyltransferase
MKASPAAAIGAASLQRLRSAVHDLADRFGVDVVPYTSIHHFVGRRARLFRALNINLVFDIGANTGQYAMELRRFGYRGQIVSFEPLQAPYETLSKRAALDEKWDVVNIALGRHSGRQAMNVAANSASSSLLDMLPLHENAAPHARYVGVEPVAIARLDDIAVGYLTGTSGLFLKIDAQGYESEILAGGTELLPRIVGLEIELSLAHLYASDTLIDETITELKASGFHLVDLRPAFADPRTGQLLQADGIFARSGPE